MSGGTFVHFGSPWSSDHSAELQREHARRRAEMDRQQRCERWIIRQWSGVTFTSREALTKAVLERATLIRGPLDSETFRVLSNAANAVFNGICAPSRSTRVLSPKGIVVSVTLRAA